MTDKIRPIVVKVSVEGTDINLHTFDIKEILKLADALKTFGSGPKLLTNEKSQCSPSAGHPNIRRPHRFHCPKCGKIVDNSEMFDFFKALSGTDEKGFYIDFGDEKRYLYYWED